MPPDQRRNVLLLITGNSVSMLGTSVYLVALMLYLTETTASATTLGMVQFVAHLPGVVLAPFAGAVVDALPRLRVVVWSDLARGVLLIVAGLWGVVYGALPGPLIYTVVFLYGMGGAFFVPAVHALIPEIVPAPQVKRVNAWKQATQQTANFGGNALGGLLFAAVGAPMLFLANGVSFCISALSESWMRLGAQAPATHSPTPHPPTSWWRARAGQSIWARSREGARYARDHHGVRSLLLLNAGIQLIAPPLVIAMPFVVMRALNLGPAAVGLAFAAMLAGGVAGFAFTGGVRREAEYPTVIGAVWLLGIAALTAGFRLNVFTLFLLLVVAGAAVAAIHLVCHTLIQTRVPRFVRGRIYALWETGGLIAAPCGYLVAGPLIDWLNGNFGPLFLGLGIIGIAAGSFLPFVRPLRRLF